jgi:hypothetical protein
MEIFWWQAGLHIKPETKAEMDALIFLWEATKTLPHISDVSCDSTSSIIREEILNNIAGN